MQLVLDSQFLLLLCGERRLLARGSELRERAPRPHAVQVVPKRQRRQPLIRAAAVRQPRDDPGPGRGAKQRAELDGMGSTVNMEAQRAAMKEFEG